MNEPDTPIHQTGIPSNPADLLTPCNTCDLRTYCAMLQTMVASKAVDLKCQPLVMAGVSVEAILKKAIHFIYDTRNDSFYIDEQVVHFLNTTEQVMKTLLKMGRDIHARRIAQKEQQAGDL